MPPSSKSGDDEANDGGLGARPAEDALALEVARAKIANALFATEERVRIGRYQLLQRAGAGGMGVVWSAWDPELDRRVAIKLMHAKSEAARAVLLREGQALAKLSHPHIVPIYDVGTEGDQVYLVIEWIAGATLRAYCAAPRTTKEIVAMFREAGAGLWAAHKAGIVHRDVKPDNVMIGDDGRARVLDFGLALTSGDAGSAAGTPRYMAPEQAAGQGATAASDQFSFGKSLREALEKSGEVPAWLAAVIARATQPAASDRYPDLGAMLDALARDPARVWRRRAAVAAAIAAAGAAFAVGATRQRATAEVCSGAGDELAEVWSEERARELVGHVQTLGQYGADEAEGLAAQLGDYGARWATARRAACLALHRDELTPALYERGLACLERARSAVDAVATALSRSPLERLPASILAARNLPAAERCLAEATTDPVAPPPVEQLAQARALEARVSKVSYLALAADPSALALAQAAARAARALGYAPLMARAQIALGAALALDPKAIDGPIAAYGAAAEAALAGGDDVTFVEAFARELFTAAKRGAAKTAQLAAALPFVATMARRTGDSGRFARTLLYNNAATERMAAGERGAAIEWLRKARAEPQPAERGAELWVVLGNLAMLVPDRGEREALFAEEQAQLTRTLGADHPFTFEARMRAALFVEDPTLAVARLAALCPAYQRLHPQKRFELSRCFYELGWIAAERGDDDAARRAYEQMVAIAGDDGSSNAGNAVTAKAELLRSRGELAAAIALAEPLAKEAEAAEKWWSRLPAADAWMVVAMARQARGERTAAIAAWRAARAVLDDAAKNTQATAVLRHRARAGAALAIATKDRQLADAVIGWYAAAGGYDAQLAALRW